MSKEFTLEPAGVDVFNANDYVEITKNSEKYLYKHSKSSKSKYFGYCTGGCNLKVFRSKPTTENGDYFFKHVKGYYTSAEQHRMLSCKYYEPTKGSSEQPHKLSPIYLDEIINFIKVDSYWIFKYINAFILKDLGIMSSDYYIKVIKNIFVDNVDTLSTSDKISTKLLPYNIFELMFRSGKIDYKDIKPQTINFSKLVSKLSSEGIKYFDYILFILTGNNLLRDVLGLEVIQSKEYGKDLKKPKTLMKIEIPVHINELSIYISKNKNKDLELFSLSDNEINHLYEPKQAGIIIENKMRYNKIFNEINKLF